MKVSKYFRSDYGKERDFVKLPCVVFQNSI